MIEHTIMRKIIQNLVFNISNQSSDLERSFSGLAVKCYAEGELARDCPNPEDICYTKREFFELFAIFGLSKLQTFLDSTLASLLIENKLHIKEDPFINVSKLPVIREAVKHYISDIFR